MKWRSSEGRVERLGCVEAVRRSASAGDEKPRSQGMKVPVVQRLDQMVGWVVVSALGRVS